MASYRRAEEHIPTFLCFLLEKDVIKDYKLKKEVARTIFMEEFKPRYDIKKFSFCKMNSFLKYFQIVKHDTKTDTLIFKPNILNNVTSETDITNRKKFKIAPILQAQQTSKIDPKPNMNEPAGQSELPKPNKKNSERHECKVCSITFYNIEKLKLHQKTDTHKLRMDYVTKKKTGTKPSQELLAEVASAYGGGSESIIIRLNESKEIVLKLLNRSTCDYSVTKIINIIEINGPTSLVKVHKTVLPCLLAANFQLCLRIQILCSEIMCLQFPIIFTLKNEKTGKEIEVLKELIFHVYSSLVEDLRPTEPYNRPPKPVIYDAYDGVVRGEHPDKKETDFKPKLPLPKYDLPDNITVLLNTDLKEFKGMTIAQRNILRDIKILLDNYELKNTLNKQNYFDILQLALRMEEHQMKIDIRNYDVDGQELKIAQVFRAHCLELSVPGLAEHRPSLLRGDSVFLKENKQSRTKYEGIVHMVKLNSVILGFNRKFIKNVHIAKKKYSVSFTFNRITLRAEHQAIQLAKGHNVIHILCSEKVQTRQLKDHHLTWHNRNIENNKKQQQAVHYILSETSRPMPYLIFGPPGTGKTVTVVEAILQIWKIKPTHKVLVCAPSNSAANEITKRLIKHVPQRDLFRYVAPSFPYNQIEEDIKPYINYDDDYYHPSITKLMTYRIVITTLVTASRLVNGGTPVNHFSYVFIDESGQATESETLIPIAGILTSIEKAGSINGQIVLAGDPKQLGPIIHSNKAEKCGFGISMLERLMSSNPIYQKNINGQYNDAVLTKLVKSYRSHPVILTLPNELFYDGELEAAGERDFTHIAVNWEELPNPKFPVIFHSVMGKDEREGNSPSFFNLQEVDVVLKYLEKLIGNRLSGTKITEDHIGIIAPYRKQVQKLRKVCEKKQWRNLSIGSVEQFQGQERRIIIVSTVRVKPEFLTHDEKFHLGFLRNPKRYNVAITRAKALLIVVGNPEILKYDEHWYAFIKYCKDNGSCTGTPFKLPSTYNGPLVDLVAIGAFITNGINGKAISEDGPNFSRGNI